MTLFKGRILFQFSACFFRRRRFLSLSFHVPQLPATAERPLLPLIVIIFFVVVVVVVILILSFPAPCLLSSFAPRREQVRPSIVARHPAVLLAFSSGRTRDSPRVFAVLVP